MPRPAYLCSAHRYPGCFGSIFFGLARPPCAAVLRAWWKVHSDWSMRRRWSSGSPMWSTWLAGQSHRSPVSPRMAMHRCPSRSSTARRMDAQFGGSGEVRPLVALQGIPPPKLQPRRSAPSWPVANGAARRRGTPRVWRKERNAPRGGLGKFSRPSQVVKLDGRGCYCIRVTSPRLVASGRRRNRTPALSDLTVF